MLVGAVVAVGVGVPDAVTALVGTAGGVGCEAGATCGGKTVGITAGGGTDGACGLATGEAPVVGAG
ncbi:MAG: hypothetical protein HY675_18440 [Chloroflexi bacterium]|nr:hypothetical protein [Chloroflexota bacterium]